MNILLPYQGPYLSVFFLLTNRVLSESICRICPLIIADVVDEHRYLTQRSDTATLIGASAFLGKTSVSLAPMLGYALIAQSAETWVLETRYNMSFVMIFVPFLCLAAQTLTWSNFTLRNEITKFRATVKIHLTRIHQIYVCINNDNVPFPLSYMFPMQAFTPEKSWGG